MRAEKDAAIDKVLSIWEMKAQFQLVARLLLAVALWLGWVATPSAAQLVAFDGYPKGSLIVKTAERHLYLVVGDGLAMRYAIAVGREGRQWQGRTRVTQKIRNPIWIPPPVVRKDHPTLPKSVPPGPRNPLGVAILVLGDGRYGIHGTNNPNSIGREASYGCIRMHNADILQVYQKVTVGTPVYVVK